METTMSELWSQDRLAKYLDISPRTLERQRVAGTGIPYVSIGRLVRYREADVQAYIAGRRRGSTSEAA